MTKENCAQIEALAKELTAGINEKKEVKTMAVYKCNICGWTYDEEKGLPEKGIAPGTKFEDLPIEFLCELCGVSKEEFTKEE